ncbi:hypothetical protein GCM10011316_40050 [Roseibium aquae]|uniref:Uncharacterized protein n=1 Tax=Roseibium aquae TaxID=1323746 RepID=A0A916TQ07_9HYPH|nr:hypothetical protein [Roseibium aquae]GGB64225.1 hypothetical protein GCM10011316_40050 [Roseibium aquae]
MSKDKNESALSAFISRKAELDGLLERLAALSADHFGVSPDDVHWGHVGTVADAVLLLRQVLAQLEPDQPSDSSK